jgi:hypothetical protein
MSDAYEATKRLIEERPDLVPHLKRVLALGGDGYHEDVPQEALDEFVRRGLLVVGAEPDRDDGDAMGHD